MSGLKHRMPGLQQVIRNEVLSQGYDAITPDEVDRYEIYNIVKPATAVAAPLFLASAGTAGTSAAVAMVINNRLPDYPRNIQFAIAGSAAGMTGTLTVNGRDQFGSSITEELTFAGASNGGTVAGTTVFGQITDGTLNYGTAVGNGTPSISFVPGTACLFGLPAKIGGTTDVVHLGMTAGTGAISYGGGTIAAFVDSPMHAIRPAAAITGSNSVVVWYKPTYTIDTEDLITKGTQAV